MEVTITIHVWDTEIGRCSLAGKEIELSADSLVLGDMDLSDSIQTLYEAAITEARQKVREAQTGKDGE